MRKQTLLLCWSKAIIWASLEVHFRFCTPQPLVLGRLQAVQTTLCFEKPSNWGLLKYLMLSRSILPRVAARPWQSCGTQPMERWVQLARPALLQEWGYCCSLGQHNLHCGVVKVRHWCPSQYHEVTGILNMVVFYVCAHLGFEMYILSDLAEGWSLPKHDERVCMECNLQITLS